MSQRFNAFAKDLSRVFGLRMSMVIYDTEINLNDAALFLKRLLQERLLREEREQFYTQLRPQKCGSNIML